MNVRTELTFHEIARRMLLKQSDDAICQQMGLNLKLLKRLTEKAEFRNILDQLRNQTYAPIDKALEEKSKDLATRIRDDAAESYERLQALLRTSASEAIQRDVAQDLLDRAGYGRQVTAPAVSINIGTLETSVLVDALKREREAHELNKDKNILELAKPVKESPIGRTANQGEGSAPSTS